MRVQLVPASERPDLSAGQWVAEAQERLDALEIPGAFISASPPSIRGLQFSTSGDDLAITVVGPELEELRSVARDIANRLEGIPGLEGVEVGRESRSPLLRIRVDRERAADLGLNVSEVGEAVRDAVNGAVPTQYIDGSVEYDLRVKLPREETRSPDALGNMLLFRGDDGEPILLRDVASFDLGTGPSHIVRENQGRVQRVVGDINTEVSDVGTIMREVEQRLRGFDLPERYSLIYGGQWETIQETNRELASVIALDRLQVDDPVGAISVHGVAGIWGTAAVGVFGGASIPVQLLGAFSYALGAFVAGFAVFMVLKATLGLRVSPAEEVRGLDIAEHGGPAYQSHDALHDPVVASTGT